MRTMILVALLTATGWAPAGLAAFDPEHPGLTTCLVDALCAPRPAFEWQGRFREADVHLPSLSTGARLHAGLVVPAEEDAAPGSHPAVVILPGSSGLTNELAYRWAARELAGHGYVALAIDPQGVGRSETFGDPACETSAVGPCENVPYQQLSNWLDAGRSALAFLRSESHPWLPLVDEDAIGVAGHSLGARAVSVLQGEEASVGAIVAWDNLASDGQGDAGSASGGGPLSALVGGEVPGESAPVTPRVPAMGQASDSRGGGQNPEVKKTAYNLWHDAKRPAMELVFRDASHLDWPQSTGSDAAKERDLQLFEYYTRAWFDLWLRDDATALQRLQEATVLGESRDAQLSERYRSALFLPDHEVDCPDLSAC